MRTALPRILAAVLCLTALLCAQAWAAKVNPDGSIAPAGEPAQAQPAAQKALDTIKKAADAQGDISPLTVKALQNDPKALEAIGRAPSRPAPPQRDGGPKSNKAMYGDIIIHK
ncbi:MAG: hypothetical protein AB7E46_11015 [Desulfovibrio sp.]